jgi:RNA polymerase primary sigma factor
MFYQLNERYPLPDELADELGMPVEKVEDILRLATTEMSLDTPIGEDSDSSIGDMLESTTPPTDNALDQESLRADINRWLLVLNDQRAQAIMEHSFGLNGAKVMTFEELAVMFRISRERVRQIHQHAIRVMKANAMVIGG